MIRKLIAIARALDLPVLAAGAAAAWGVAYLGRELQQRQADMAELDVARRLARAELDAMHDAMDRAAEAMRSLNATMDRALPPEHDDQAEGPVNIGLIPMPPFPLNTNVHEHDDEAGTFIADDCPGCSGRRLTPGQIYTAAGLLPA